MDIDRTPGRRIYLKDEKLRDELEPTIWPFKAEWIEYVGPDGLAEWEEAMRTKVGRPEAARYTYKPGCATISVAGGAWNDCDHYC